VAKRTSPSGGIPSSSSSSIVFLTRMTPKRAFTKNEKPCSSANTATTRSLSLMLSFLLRPNNWSTTFKANEAVKQFHSRTLDGVPMEVKVVPRNEQNAMGGNANGGGTKASLFGSALGGGGGRGTGRNDPSFSIVLPATAVKGRGKAGHKAADYRSAPKKAAAAAAAPKAPKAKAAPKPKAPKPEPANAGNLDNDLDSYFKANKPNKEAATEAAPEAAPVE
jgi:hypothetical protein